jgi:hypothetical protein
METHEIYLRGIPQRDGADWCEWQLLARPRSSSSLESGTFEDFLEGDSWGRGWAMVEGGDAGRAVHLLMMDFIYEINDLPF